MTALRLTAQEHEWLTIVAENDHSSVQELAETLFLLGLNAVGPLEDGFCVKAQLLFAKLATFDIFEPLAPPIVSLHISGEQRGVVELLAEEVGLGLEETAARTARLGMMIADIIIGSGFFYSIEIIMENQRHAARFAGITLLERLLGSGFQPECLPEYE